MAPTDEKLCLQSNDFRENVSSAFGDLRQDKELTDVILVCEDGQQVEAHKVVLVASSPFFLNILKRNKHPHPLIYMTGVKSNNLMAMVDIYQGEANVFQEDFDFFLNFAEELQLRGLRGTKTEKAAATEKIESKLTRSKAESKQKAETTDVSVEKGMLSLPSEKALALNDPKTNTTDVVGLDQQVRSMMVMSTNNGNGRQGKGRICKVCRKEGDMSQIMNHIEANHIAEISIPCDLCGIFFKIKTGASYAQICISQE